MLDRLRAARHNFSRQPFEGTLSLILALASFYYLISPRYRALSVVGRSIAPLDFVWCILYVVGGTLTVWGLSMRRPLTEVAGLSLEASALLLQALASLIVSAPIPVAARVVSVAIIVALVAACLQRILTLVWTKP